jgi:hypothetical protein
MKKEKIKVCPKCGSANLNLEGNEAGRNFCLDCGYQESWVELDAHDKRIPIPQEFLEVEKSKVKNLKNKLNKKEHP